jgi:alkylation response protein AidB-like acyl-CoA dehydrogenase
VQFDLPEEAESLRQAVQRFAEKELNYDLIERDAASAFWREGWQKCADFGLLGLPVPEEYGGSARDLTTTIAAMEALGYGCRDLGLIFSINAHLWTNTIPILQYGSEEQKRRYLPGLCDGKLIGANGASEPEAGSDVFSMRTRAERRGDHYVLNGQKTFVTNAQVCDLIVAYASTRPGTGQLGVTAFIIERDTPGLVIGKPIHKMGLRTSPMGEMFFEECKVPAQNLLGREGGGAACFNCSMEWERGCILAMHLGRMQRQLEQVVDHARERKQFGHPLGHFQSVANRIVDMKVRLEAARPLVYKIGWKKDRGQDAMLEAAIAKLFLSEAATASALDAIQVFGGYGYTTEYEIERDLRDAVGSRLYSGTVEIQRNIIARLIGLPPSTIPPPPRRS